MEALIQNGADIRHTNNDNYQALVYAAKHGNYVFESRLKSE